MTNRIDERARQLVDQNVCYCVSTLVSGLQRIGGDFTGEQMDLIGIEEEELFALAYADVDPATYRDNADTGETVEGNDEDGWRWKRTRTIVDPEFPRETMTEVEEEGEADSELQAWRDLFESVGRDHPDGAEIYEHWAVDDWFADKLEARGERIVRHFAGLTVWGRTTTGQAIYADYVIQQIAAELLPSVEPEAPPAAPLSGDDALSAVFGMADSFADMTADEGTVAARNAAKEMRATVEAARAELRTIRLSADPHFAR